VVDDELHARSITARMLQSEGYDVLEAGSADEALALLSTTMGVRLAVIDIVMPGTDGIALAGMMHDLVPDCGVILMSGYPRGQNTRSAALTAIPILMKPFTTNQLVQHVEAVLQRSSH
jgi:DNA-binding NtrC family response regulator